MLCVTNVLFIFRHNESLGTFYDVCPDISRCDYDLLQLSVYKVRCHTCLTSWLLSADRCNILKSSLLISPLGSLYRISMEFLDVTGFLPPANEVWSKVIFSQAVCVSRILSTNGYVPGPGGWCLVLGGVPGPGGTWFRGCVPGPGGCLVGGVVETSLGRLLLRAVRILLECILVKGSFDTTWGTRV